MQTVVFFGTDEFASHILATLIDANVLVKAIVTKPDRAKKRNKKLLPPPVKELAEQKGWKIPIFQPEKASTSEFAETLRAFEPDLFVVVSYGEIINDELLAIPRLMPINIHPSLLPKYRGASPLRSALLNGDEEIGVAVIEMVKAMDAGAIVKLERMKVLDAENHSMLEVRVFKKAGAVLLELLEDFKAERVVKKEQQGTPTFTKKFKKDDLKIDFTKSAREIVNRIRAFGSYPGAFCYVEVGGKELTLKITKAVLISEEKREKLETLTFTKEDGWKVGCMSGVFQIQELQMENKKLMQCKDFINGARGVAPALKFD